MTINRFGGVGDTVPGLTISRVVECNGFVFVRGHTPRSLTASFKVQVQEVLDGIDEALKMAGSNRSKLLQVQCFLKDIRQFPEMNEVWDQWIDKSNLPARTTVQAFMASPGIMVEMNAIAAK